jgi:aryl carrier-like protein
MLRYVGERTPWIRPSDTGRSTNCLINEAGIFVHKAERGFHNYALPYSWDVRLGHKVRDAAVAELEDELDPTNVRRMLDEVGYRERPGSTKTKRLVAYYTATREIPPSELRRFLSERLPPGTVPASFVHLEAMPLTDHGKIDRNALPTPGVDRQVTDVPFVEPNNETQRTLAEVWGEVLGVESVGIHDDFFELGGESMRCIQIASIARERGLAFSPRDLFRNPTVARLSEVVTSADPEAELVAAEVSADELDDLAREFG